MKIKLSYPLMMPDGADGGGADDSGAHGVFEGSDDPNDTGGAEGGQQQQQQQTQQGTQQGAAQQQQQQQPVLSAQEIAQLVGETVKAAVPQPQQQPQQISPEEFDRAFNMARVKAETFQQFRQLMQQETPEAFAAGAKLLEDLIQAGVRQAVTMAGYTLADLKDELMGQLTPVQQLVQQQHAQVLRQEFFAEHKDLEQWTPIVEAVTAKLQASGALKQVGNDKKKAFDLVASETKKIVQGLPSGGAGGTPVNGQQQQQSRTSRMSTLTSGGQGGTRQGGQAAGKKSAGHAVFD